MIAITRHLIAEIRRILKVDPSFHEVLKWNPNQARNPGGTSEGGRWRSAAGRGLAEIEERVNPRGWGRLAPAPGMERNMGEASYATIMNAPTGTGFTNPPRGVNLPEPPPPPAPGTVPPESQAILDTLTNEVAIASRPLGGGGVNASARVKYENGQEAAYKPERGEAWEEQFANYEIRRYITNRNFSLAEREAFAYEVDTALGLGMVPETVALPVVDETNIDVDTTNKGLDGDSVFGGGAYDEHELREMYQEYEENAREEAMDQVGEEFGELYEAAKEKHADKIEDRAQEIIDLWDEEKENFPEDERYGAASVLRGHPPLPMGTEKAFERRDTGPLDPLAVIDEAGIDVDGSLTAREEDDVREVLRKRLAEGYRKLDAVDREAAKDHLDRDDWMEEHADTENRLYASKILNFRQWAANYNRRGGGSGEESGNPRDKNPRAPHPQGGSLQAFKKADPWGDMTADDGARLAALDYVLGTMDRHPGNILWKDNKPIAIDNGYIMPGGMPTPDGFLFRSNPVRNWLGDSSSHSVSKEVRESLAKALESTDWQRVLARHPGMSDGERNAFLGRVWNLTMALNTEDGLRALWMKQRRL